MIFNTKEIVRTLTDILCNYELSREQHNDISALIGYFSHQEPKITFDEFKQLFGCTAKYSDKDHLEIKIIPRTKFSIRIDKCISNYFNAHKYNFETNMSTELKEELLEIAYGQFEQCLNQLKNE